MSGPARTTPGSVPGRGALAALAVALVAGALGACSSPGGPPAANGAANGAASSPAVGSTTPAPRADAVHTERPAKLYRVGEASFTFVDRTRPTTANGSFPGSPDRTIPTLVLYPARGEPGDASTDTVGAPRAPGRFPLVVFSHGFTASGPAYRALLREWARRGYVVAAPTFPLSNGAAPGGPVITDVANQPRDVSFVIDSLERLSGRDGAWRGFLDERRIAAAGHSLGAVTTLLVTYNSCCTDPRIRAAVPISGLLVPLPGTKFFTGRAVPLLLVHGDRDRTVPYQGSARAFEEAPPPKFLLTLEGAPHTPFGDPRWARPIVAVVADFLDAYLEHRPGALARMEADATATGAARLESDLDRPPARAVRPARGLRPGRAAAVQPIRPARRAARTRAASSASLQAVP